MKTAWIDIATNVISQSEVSALDMMEHLRSEGAVRPLLLPIFLHEFTHHWCFNSFVGFSLLLLRERARCLIASSDLASDVVQRRLWSAVCRYNMATKLVAPLIEGMALFAEFDTLMGDSKSLSNPVDWCAKLFRIHATSNSELIHNWLAFVQSVRGSDRGIARKSLLLSAPMESSARGDYLRGYLCFRSLHRRAAMQNESFRNDHDLFVTYTRHLFFNDPSLAGLLLDHQSNVSDWSERFQQRLDDRIGWLLTGQTTALTAEFDERIAARSYDEREQAHLLGLAMSDVDEFRSTMQQWIRDPTDGLATREWLSDWGPKFAALAAFRSLVRLASSSAIVRVDSKGNVFANDRFLGPTNAGRAIACGETQGAVTLYFVPEATALLLIVEQGKEVVRIGAPEALRMSAVSERVIRSAEAFHALVAHGVYGANEIQMSEMVECFAGLPDVVDSTVKQGSTFWSDLAFADVEPSRREKLLAGMRRAGFGELLNCDRILVDGLSTISAFSACRRSIEELEAHMKSKGADLPTLLSLLSITENQYGIRLLATEPEVGTGRPHTVRCFI